MKALDWKPEEEYTKGNYFPKCLIIYPDPNTRFEREKGDSEDETEESAMIELTGDFSKDGILCDSLHLRKIPGFKDFYKIAVPLPKK